LGQGGDVVTGTEMLTIAVIGAGLVILFIALVVIVGFVISMIIASGEGWFHTKEKREKTVE
jgi:hypothetical protein